MARKESSQKQTALEHLHELWVRLLSSVIVIFVAGGIAYVFRVPIINFLQHPLHEKLYYNSPMGSFQFIMQVCLLVGIVVALPILIYNMMRFIEPAFDKDFSRRLLFIILFSSLFLASVGVAFGYYLTLPFSLQFFQSVASGTLLPLITANEYFNFILGYLATFALVFQLPLLLLFINHITPFKPGGLSRWRKHVYIGAFAISLIMPSSPDPLSQISLAIPIIVLYEFSNFLISRVNRNRNRRTARIQYIPVDQSDGSQDFVESAAIVARPESAMPGNAAVDIERSMSHTQGRRLAPDQNREATSTAQESLHNDAWHRRDAVPDISLGSEGTVASDVSS